MDTQHFIAYGIFFFVVSIELFISYRQHRKLYQAQDITNNLTLGLFTTIFLALAKGTFIAVFSFFNRFAIWDIPMVWWSWILLFFANEFIFYWVHRISHVSRFFWAFHVAHHSSLNYNFSTSVRNNFLIQTFRYGFYIPLALIGFDPLAIILMDSIAYFAQLWVHTQVIRKLGPVGWIFNTPSHHRVHHAVNPQYIDKNYGAILIIWDRIFGSFQKEEEPVRFGITKQVRQNVPNILFHEFIAIGKDLGRAGSFPDAIRYIFGHPAWGSR